MFGDSCVSFDYSAINLRCYLGDARAGDDDTCTVRNTGASTYHYYERHADAKKTEAAKAEELTKKEEAAKKAVADGLAKKAAAVGLF